jgi:hypothetical protein
MKAKVLLSLSGGIFLFFACDRADDASAPKVKKEIFGGYVQKGPFNSGTSVWISELDEQLDQTGRVYSTTIADNSGRFSQRNIELISSYVELRADGYYFNEVTGQTAPAPITLSAFADVSDVSSANVNVLTHLAKPRIEYLVKQEGKDFADAQQQAESEVLAIFGWDKPAEATFDKLDLVSSGILLAVSAIAQGYSSPASLLQLLAEISADIAADGQLDDAMLGSALAANAAAIALPAIRSNLEQKYGELNQAVDIPDFEAYVQQFVSSTKFEIKSLIKYPSRGLYGANLLADDLTEADVYEGEPHQSPAIPYSLCADVPEGMSLTVVAELEGCLLGLLTGSGINWDTQSTNNHTRKTYSVIDGGQRSDYSIALEIMDTVASVTLYYYENGATEVTRVKQVKLVP